MMKKTKKDKYFVLSIARADLVHNYPAKYQRDTKKYPIFQAHLRNEDDNVFVVHESDINNIVDEQDFIEADCFFECGHINKMTVESNDTDETCDAWLDHNYGLPVGTTRDERKAKEATMKPS